MPRLRLLSLPTLLVALVLALPARAGIALPVYDGTLPNGLRLIVSPDPASPDVTVFVRYAVGAADEPGGLEGLAHLVEHILFFGSRHVDAGGFARLLEQAGAADVNGETSSDTTVYYETLPPERLELALWLESERMAFGLDRLDETTLSRARAEVQNERRERVDDQALGAVPAIIVGELFPGWHPYHHLPIGFVPSVGQATLSDVRAFVRTWYGPANAIVVIAGNVNPTAAGALVTRYFGTLPSNPPPARPALPALQRNETTVVNVAASVSNEEVRVSWVTPRFGAPGDAELDLAAALLVDRSAGWLDHALMGTPRLARTVSAWQESRDAASIFTIRAVAARGVALRVLLTNIGAAIDRFEVAAPDDEIQRAKMLFQRAKLFSLETSKGRARALASIARFGKLPATFDGDVGRHAAITPSGVRDAVRRWLGKPWVAVMSHPATGTTPAGVVLGKAGVSW